LEPVTAELRAIAVAGQGLLRNRLDLVEAPELGYAFAPADPPRYALLVHREARRVIGEVRFERTAGTPLTYEIGYSINPGWRRQGLAVEAAGCLIAWLKERMGAQYVIAGCHRDNIASIRTLRRLGFWLDSTRGQAFWWVHAPDGINAVALPD
jgi:RimJ/RimL family protein N-acetyltransferase